MIVTRHIWWTWKIPVAGVADLWRGQKINQSYNLSRFMSRDLVDGTAEGECWKK